MVLTLIRDLLGAPGFFGHRCPCDASINTSVIPASGYQDRTTSRPLRSRSSHATSASTAPRCYARDDRPKRPSHRRGMAEMIVVICPTTQADKPATNWHDGQNMQDVPQAASINCCRAIKFIDGHRPTVRFCGKPHLLVRRGPLRAASYRSDQQARGQYSNALSNCDRNRVLIA